MFALMITGIVVISILIYTTMASFTAFLIKKICMEMGEPTEGVHVLAGALWPVGVFVGLSIIMYRGLLNKKKKEKVNKTVVWPVEITTSEDYRKIKSMIAKYEYKLPVVER